MRVKAGLKRDDYTWRQIRPGLWQRDADEAEVFYSTLIKLYEGTGRMHFAITGHISLTIKVPDDESPEVVSKRLDDSLRIAWLRQRYETPTIASHVHYDALDGKWKKSYRTIPDDASTKAWLDKTFQVIKTGQTGEEWANSDPPAPNIATLFVVCPAATSSKEDPSTVRRDLILRSPHDIIDGIGTLQLLNSLVTKTAAAFREGDFFRELPIFDGSEASNLSPPYRVAANVPSVPTPEQQARLDAMASSITSPSQPPPNPDSQNETPPPMNIGIPHPLGPSYLHPGKHQRTSHFLSPSLTTSITTYLKTNHPGTTVTHLFHAAIALSLRNLPLTRTAAIAYQYPKPQPGSGQKVRYTNYLLRNERPSCLPPYDSPAHCVSVYHSLPASKLIVDMSSSLPPDGAERRKEYEEVLGKIRQFYEGVRDDKLHYALAPAIWKDWTPSLPEAVLKGEEKMEVPKPKEVPSVSISSMGVVDRVVGKWHDLGLDAGGEDGKEGKLEVHRPWVTGEELTNGLGVFLGTFDGVLELSCAYNETWHSKENVDNFLWDVERMVTSWVEGGSMEPK
ncbi:hypothetical protein B0T20DRAFT_371507 [Sordaria brevicollis]|uniref:Uncharacterized protein n=1 Tax=Sordaria brevicollis TaxID=83679 RepID=A0AAE0PIX4_SORBR|nr:hypothetical protein B0T20DRAFT_371507 [Sordaria brevicollis]